MPTPRQVQALSKLVPTLDAIGKYDPSGLVQKERLGSALCFESVLPLLTEVTATARQLAKVDFETVPYGTLNHLRDVFAQLNQTLAQISQFDPKQHGNTTQARDSLANSLEDQWNSAYTQARAVLGTRGEDSVRSEMDALASQVRSTMQLSSDALNALNMKTAEAAKLLDVFLKDKAKEFEELSSEKLQGMTAALDEIRKAAAEAGVSQTSRHFSDEAEEHRKASALWLAVLVAISIMVVGFALFGSHVTQWTGVPEPSHDASDMRHLRYLGQKALIVFLLFFGVLWAARNYGAARHNYVVNKHRTNALGSFQAFAASATDEQTKSAVLVQATQSVFLPQASGYVKTDGENAAASPIIEILRSVGGSKEK